MQRFRIGALTDIFSQEVAQAASAMRECGMKGAELRSVGGRNIIEVPDDELNRALESLRENALEVVAIDSMLFKCPLERLDTQSGLVERSFEIAKRAGARIIRAFSFYRVAEPESVFERVVDVLQDFADKAGRLGLVVGLENDPCCNIGTAHESAAVLAAIDHWNLQLIWDPANAYLAGEKPSRAGYKVLDTSRIALIHAKDCVLDSGTPVWTALGDGVIDWQGQIDALAEDGYCGFIHLESSKDNKPESALRLKKMVEALAL